MFAITRRLSRKFSRGLNVFHSGSYKRGMYFYVVNILIFLPPAYVVRREGNSLSLLVCPQGMGVPILDRSKVPIPLDKIPNPPPPQPGQDGGGGTPRYLPPSQVRTGELSTQGTYPPAKVPTPPCQELATQRAVRLLRSRRRSFLYSKKFVF